MRARLLPFAGWLLCAAAVAAALQWLASTQLRAELVREAVAALSPLARGDTPHRWDLSRPGTLVGRRVHGDCDAAFDDGGLVLRRGSRQCEIAVTLRVPLDLVRFDALEIAAGGPLPEFTLQIREQLAAPQHLAEAAGSSPWQLDRLAWRLDRGDGDAAPARAAMLRLRFAALDADLHLRAIALLPADRTIRQMTDLASSAWRPLKLGLETDPRRAPLFAVDGLQRPETVLLARDDLREREPAAVVVYRDDIDRVVAGLTAAPPAGKAADWLPAGLALLLCVATIALRGRRRARALLQALLALAVPVWLIAGLRIGDDPDGVTQALVALAALYAVALAATPTATPWRWLGRSRAWMFAAAAPLIAFAIVLLAGRPDPAALSPVALAGYLLWALAQQYLICAVVADRLRTAGIAARWTVLAAAAAFSLLHAPNAGLMLATFLSGLIWSALWLRERSLLPLAASHAVSALVLTSGLPPAWLRSAEVSLRYYL
ncbi:MAG TPA: CPBP family intramembrane glutamic endopeptidase [Tahibacter sp.]|uniref:CPBP family intramembrane glutamic endopeptidase n=1 Tax=Tahibacter sp. TaxID=2056211 RepID=UPI002C656FDC|nr:CPBP family intramembrane glutamic endopeptidase [Tahibacter sp.]HSX59693.1 CPBP family intramembrane glutamic endopeptidase [Tahibacter sp.]